MANVGLLLRSLLIKGYLIGDFEDKIVSEMNTTMRSLNMRVVKILGKNQLVLVNSEPKFIQTVKTLENLDNFIRGGDNLNKDTTDLFLSLNWIDETGFTPLFYLQNEDFLIDKYRQYFKNCTLCDILIYGEASEHEHCKKYYKKRAVNIPADGVVEMASEEN